MSLTKRLPVFQLIEHTKENYETANKICPKSNGSWRTSVLLG